MEYKFNFTTEEEKNNLIEQYSNMYIKDTVYGLCDKYIILTDEFHVKEESWEDEIKSKISILEAENAQMQYAMMMGGLL